jgi:hypothetical protein
MGEEEMFPRKSENRFQRVARRCWVGRNQVQDVGLSEDCKRMKRWRARKKGRQKLGKSEVEDMTEGKERLIE